VLDTAEGWFYMAGLVVGMIHFVAWIVFARVSMARIERRLTVEGHPRPCPWDGTGARTLWYAYAITLPVGRWNRLDDPFIEVSAVRRYSTRADRVRGSVLMISGYCLLMLIVAWWFLFDLGR